MIQLGVSFNAPGLGITATGGSEWFFGSVDTFASPVTEADLLASCPFQNATIVSQNGADNGSYAADDFMGITFRAQPNGDPLTYEYRIGIEGVTTTVVVNERTVFTAPNVAPTANAGSNQSVQSGTQVTLDGSGSADSDGSIASYAWSRTGGTGSAADAMLNDATAENPTFTDNSLNASSSAVTHIFELVVTDDDGESSVADSVTITITPPPNTAPTANAGTDQTIPSGSLVTLDGSASSDPDTGQTLTYSWMQVGSPAVSLSDPTADMPTFTAPTLNLGDADVGLTFSLTVSDGITSSVAATVTVTVEAPADTVDPVVTVPADISVNTDPGASTAVVSYAGAMATDNVGVTSGPTLTGGLASGAAFPVGITVVTFEAADAAGNTGSASFSVTVNDNEDPIVSGPSDVVVSTDSGQNIATVTYAIPTATDNVGVASGPALTAGLASGASFPLGTTTVTYTATDAAGNAGAASFNVTVNDNEAPVVSVPANIMVATDPGQNTATVTYATPTATDNVAVTTAPALTAGLASGAIFPVGVTTVTFQAGDAAGNLGDASFTVTVTDDENPVVNVPADIAVTTDAGQSTATVTYPAPTATDNIAVTSGPTLTAGLASGAGFPVGVTVVTYQATDNEGNVGEASFNVTVTDAEDPVVSVPANIVVSADPGLTTAVVTYAAPTATDNVAVTTGPALTAGLASGAAFPTGMTTVTYQAGDAAGNTGTASFTVTVSDTEAPVITPPAAISAEAGPGGTANVSFAAVVTDNAAGSITPVYTLAGNAISSPFDFAVGANTVLVDATDAAGNMAAQQSFVVTVAAAVAPDAPLITTSVINANRSLTIGGTAEADSIVNVTFPDNSMQSVTATGGTYSVTSAADMTGGTVSVTATDAVGNTSAAATVDLFPDFDGPTVAISGAPSSISDATPFVVTITFSETVTGFVQGDLSVTGGNVTSFAGSGTTYTAQITPLGTEVVTINVAAGVAEDDFANPNEASATVSIGLGAITATEEMITQTARQRARQLIQSQPQINRFLLGGHDGRFNLSATQGAGNFDLGTASDRPIWLSARGQWSTQDDLEGAYANLTLGSHYEVREGLLIGAMAQFDTMTSDDGPMEFESTGWLVGPYAVVRLPEQDIVFSGSYLLGQTDNTLSPLGTYEDDFTGDRSILTLNVAGEVALDRVTLIPMLDLAHVRDENEAYLGGDGFEVRAITVTTTEARLGIDFIVPISMDDGALDLLGGFGANASVFDDGFIRTESDRGEVRLGARYAFGTTGQFSIMTSYDGIGDDSYEAFGASALLEFDF
ncbi:HYR domain-containing protein [Yoonia sp. GPGPB17]|uniref:HYR domain-containing protein n=1 Tax=Yoonia sp. GPGPB17 TaxID=3026147 RepID=UPI0030BEF1D6